MEKINDYTNLPDEALALAQAIAASIPKNFAISMLSLKSKVPFKALSYREILIHRIADQGLTAAECLVNKRPISAATMTRGVMETFSRLFEFYQKTEKFLKFPKAEALDEFLMTRLFGSKNNEDLPKAVNILTTIDKTNREIPHFRENYDRLSEVVHPNYQGGLGSLAEIDQENFQVDFESERRRRMLLHTTALALTGTLEGSYKIYDRSAESMIRLNAHFEHAI